VVVDEKTPPGTGTGRRGEWPNSAGEIGDTQANWREWGYASKLEGKSPGFGFPVADYAGPHDVSRQNLSSGLPERAPGDRGWRGKSGWMKTQIRVKRGTGGATGPFFAVRIKNRLLGAFPGAGCRCS
jgi:hypothetical protein